MIGRLSYQGVLRLVLAHWWVEPGPGFLTIRIWGTDLVLAFWLLGLGPGPSGGQGWTPGWLGAQGVLLAGGAVSPFQLAAWSEASQI